MNKNTARISALKVEIIDRNYVIVQENETNNLLLLNAELQKVKTLEGVRSANCLDLHLQSDFFNL